MIIGIDISQLAYPNTGVANYLKNLVQNLLDQDSKNQYILFFSSLRGKLQTDSLKLKNNPRVKIKRFRIPPTVLDILWNKLHILPIENFIGDVDLFITSDWTEPPAKHAKKATILYDLVVYKYPNETAKKIVEVQKRKLQWAKIESSMFFCISEATADDANKFLGIDKNKLVVINAGI
jgi:hypothetical protein